MATTIQVADKPTLNEVLSKLNSLQSFSTAGLSSFLAKSSEQIGTYPSQVALSGGNRPSSINFSKTILDVKGQGVLYGLNLDVGQHVYTSNSATVYSAVEGYFLLKVDDTDIVKLQYGKSSGGISMNGSARLENITGGYPIEFSKSLKIIDVFKCQVQYADTNSLFVRDSIILDYILATY